MSRRAGEPGSAVELRDYQREAVVALHEALGAGGRAQLHAACGSGKTLISVHAANRLVPGDGLVVLLAPWLSLVSQALAVWSEHGRWDGFLAVCGDETVADAAVHTSDLPAEVTTDPGRVATWAAATTGRRLIVGTYRSAHCLAEGLRTAGVSVDLAVFDEAHHLAGRADYVTRKILSDQVLPCRRRLYMTATPRIDDVRAETSGGLSMDDTELFGPVAYTYPWARAIRDGYLDDYRVVILGVTQSEVLDLLRDEERRYTDRPGGPDMRMCAAQAVIAHAARVYGLRRILAFCPRLEAAAEFTSTFGSTLRMLPEDRRPEGALYISAVTGEMDLQQRQRELQRLAEPPGHWTVLANVRCLSEGVDVPAVDAVAFCHPKSSQVETVQAVGRALRRSPGGAGIATVIVPIVVPDSEEEIGDLDPGDYRVLWQVVRALRAHDEALGIELDSQRSHSSIRNPQLPGKITVELPAGTGQAMVDALTLLTVKQTTSAWWEGYGHARDYHARYGHLDVRSEHVTPNGFRLGNWIINARQHRRKGWLRPDRIAALDKIGMNWDTRHLPWLRFLDELGEYKRQHGHLLVPQNYKTPSGYPLGSKVNTTRTFSGRVPEHVRTLLDDLGMVWDTRAARWQQLVSAALEYRQTHGHLNVPRAHVTADGFPLGKTLRYRVQLAREGKLDPAERATLEELGVVFDQAPDRAWRELLAACDRYVAEHGSLAGVEKGTVDSTGYRLGQALSYYRTLHNRTKPNMKPLPEQRKQALDERGMVWNKAPVRDLTPAEADRLRSLAGADLGREIVHLVDVDRVTQSSVAAALNMHRSYLSSKIKTFRETGRWPHRSPSAKR